jgi:hypothetical protein
VRLQFIKRGTVCVATLILFVLSSSPPYPGLPSLAAAQTPKQFALTIKQRKITEPTNVIRVTQGDLVQISLMADEPAELHLHGYDLTLSLMPNIADKIEFTAKIAGRFPLEAHRFGLPGKTSHPSRPLLYLEVLPR